MVDGIDHDLILIRHIRGMRSCWSSEGRPAYEPARLSVAVRWGPGLTLRCGTRMARPVRPARGPALLPGAIGRSFIRAEDLVPRDRRTFLDRPAASGCHRGRDHDEDGRDDDADDPPGPVDAARRRNPERCGEVVADEHAADPADNGEPERDVVAVAGREELAQQADDDAGDDQTDDVHRRPLSLLGWPC